MCASSAHCNWVDLVCVCLVRLTKFRVGCNLRCTFIHSLIHFLSPTPPLPFTKLWMNACSLFNRFHSLSRSCTLLLSPNLPVWRKVFALGGPWSKRWPKHTFPFPFFPFPLFPFSTPLSRQYIVFAFTASNLDDAWQARGGGRKGENDVKDCCKVMKKAGKESSLRSAYSPFNRSSSIHCNQFGRNGRSAHRQLFFSSSRLS